VAVGAATVVLSAPAASAAANGYVVRPGDTLSEIAARLGTSVSRLAHLNRLKDPNQIIAGTTLRTSGAVSASSPGGTYLVRPGDTLSAIAARLGTSVSALARSNNIANPNMIIAGTRLRVSGGGGAPASSSASVARSATHLVRPGETLSSIAARYGTSVSVLARRNGLSNPNMIISGTRLAVPPARRASLPSAPAPASTSSIESSLTRHARSHGVDVSLVKAVAYLESGWQQHVVSSAGAIGVMQLLPSTARYVNQVLSGHNLDPKIADDNVHLGVMYLRHLIATMGSERRALAGYYTGPGNVGKKFNKAQRWYVSHVMSLRDRYR
jgi:N-acetylmuramoyl-L-alanine amidase